MVLNGLTKHLNLMKISKKNLNSDRGYFVEVNVQSPEQLHELLNDMRIGKSE